MKALVVAGIAVAVSAFAGDTEFAVGVATSMESVRPRAGYVVRPASEVRIRLARDEYESVQVLVAASNDLKNVTVHVDGDLNRIAGDGVVFAASNITSSVVGYVHTTNVPPYKVRPTWKKPETGWWADPILDFQKSADVAKGDVQSFWVRVKCPRGQEPGTYVGTLSVLADGEDSVRLPFTVRVNAFAIGASSPLPLMVSCFAPWVRNNALPKEGRDEIARRIRNSDYFKAWKSNEVAYCDFLSDYYVSWGADLYPGGDSSGEPRWAMLKRQKDRGRLGFFNLYLWYPMGGGPNAEAEWRKKTIPVIRARYEKAKTLGIADHAILYGCDEADPPAFTNVARTAAELRREFPDVPVMTTARDYNFGTGDSPLREVNAFCPIISKFLGPKIAEARAEGRKVWWYISCDPCCPWPNTLIECPPIETRSLMGAMTQKFKPDGFLYYATTHWYAKDPIKEGPFTKWEPRSFGAYHGDGQWTCCGGPDNMPLPTIRLENFRDGVEDLWYVKLLEEKLREVESSKLKVESEEWIRRAKAALAVPNEVARSVAKFSTDSDVIYRWRDAMADLIEAAPH